MAVIEQQLGICRWLYNTALEHRITAQQAAGKSISYKDQQNELPSIKEQFPEFKRIHSQGLQNILRRVDGSFQYFFRRVKRGEKPGFPGFKGKDRFDSICYPQSGFRMVGNKVELSRIGHIKIKLHRPTQGNIKTCTLKKSGHQWYVIVASEIIRRVPKRPVSSAIGIDLDLNIRKMAEGQFAKSIQDAGRGKFIEMLKYKAESAGAYAIAVNPHHTSQICSNCGRLVKKEIYQRSHDCPGCGLSMDRDHNAAINILKSGTDAVFQMPRQLAAG